MDHGFFHGVRLAVTGLLDASKKASYSLGFGATAAGVALAIFDTSTPASLLVTTGIFLTSVRLGAQVDEAIVQRKRRGRAATGVRRGR